MATITIRNLPDDLVERVKQIATRNHRSMEEEVRQALRQHYRTKQQILDELRNRPPDFRAPSAGQVRAWIRQGRNRRRSGL